MLSNMDMRIFLEALALEHPSLFEAMQRESSTYGGLGYEDKVQMIREVISTEIRKLQLTIEESFHCDRSLGLRNVVFLGGEDFSIIDPHIINKSQPSDEAVHCLPRNKRKLDSAQPIDLTGTNHYTLLHSKFITHRSVWLYSQ